MADREWRGEISDEGREILGFVEGLARESRRELAAVVEMLCRSQGYHSLQDGVVELEFERKRRRGPDRARRRDQLAEVIRHPHWSEE